MTAPHVGAQVHGSLAGFPLVAEVWTDAGSLCWRGELRIEGKTLHELVHLGDDDPLDPVLSALLAELVRPLPATLDVSFERKLLTCSLSAGALSFWALRRGRSMAFALVLGEPEALGSPASPALARLWATIGGVRKALGSPALLLAYRRGDLSLHDISRGRVTSAAPDVLASASFLLVGQYNKFGGSTAGKAIGELFGGTGELLDLVAGYDADRGAFTICLAVPAMRTKYVEVDGLYILVNAGAAEPRFEFRGGFRFPRWKNVALHAASSFTPTSFLLSAEVDFPQSYEIPFLDAVAFDNAALLIGSSGGGLTFGFYGTLHIRNFLLFGALILNMEESVPVPMLVSGAIGRLSIPALYESFTGRTLDGLGALDMIALDGIDLDGIDLSFPRTFDVDLFANGDTDAIVAFFNAQVPDALALHAGEIQIRRYDGGHALVDLGRMRHYFVDARGALSLRAQFYFSWAFDHIPFGSFTVSRGLFLCGTIQVFDVPFVALFSLREDDGLLAYARLGPIHIGDILTISAATRDTTQNPIDLPDDDPIRALVPAKNDGLVFYLSASKREVAFHFDGKVALLDLFKVDARIIYAARNVSIHLATSVLGVDAMVAIDASYEDFASASLHVRLSVETKGLVAKLDRVTGAIDGAISSFTKAMNDAQRSLDTAQARVDELRGEIDALDGRIKKCRDAIRSASKIKKLLVTIAKGAEIAAYEVAKAGIWTAMKAATAVLSLAKKAVSVFTDVSAGILELVDMSIRAASSLVFLRHVEIEADLDGDRQAFEVDIAFVALGKLYTYQKSVEYDVLRQGLLPFLADKLLGCMDGDLEDLTHGRAPAPAERRAFAARALPEQALPIPDIEGASATLRTASNVFDLMQTQYRESFGEDLSDFDALRASFLGALEVTGHALATATKAALGANGLHDAIEAEKTKRGELSANDVAELDKALSEVKHASALQESVDEASEAVAMARETVLPPPEAPKAEPKAKTRAFAAAPPRVSEEDFLGKLYRDVVRTYAEEAEPDYIDLSREPALHRSFADGLSALGSAPEKEVRTRAASFAAPQKDERPYRPRL